MTDRTGRAGGRALAGVLVLGCGTIAGAAAAQPVGQVGEYSDVTVEGAILEPRPLPIADDADLLARLKAPEGVTVNVFARDLINPRMLAVSPAGRLYATRRSVGDVVMLPDADGDGRAEAPVVVATRAGMHGIAFAGDRVVLATVNDVYVADVAEDGRFGPLHRIISDLPDAGQHPNRTLGIGPDGMLYISAGSTCNACPEDNPENATLLRARPDGTSRTIFASGLRNTIGFAWDPGTGELWGMDHGIDWLGNEAQVEELNHLRQGRQYGWPYIYGMGDYNPQDTPPKGMTLADWAAASDPPVLGYTPHAAPMQMAFSPGGSLGEAYRGDAFVAMRGSWNRRPPAGYEVVRIDFQDGRPVAAEPFLSGFLAREGQGAYRTLGRPTGIAIGPEGAMYVADDTLGVVYRLTGEGGGTAAAGAAPDVVPPPPAGPIARDLFDAPATVAVTAPAFADGAPIPLAHAADGDNASPALSWDALPEGTKSLVIVMDDPDAAAPKPFLHWLAYDIPASIGGLPEGLPGTPVLRLPEGMKQGRNSMGSTGYTGPKPPVGDPPHHYHIQVFALSVPTLDIAPGAKRDEVLAAMKGHVVAEGETLGTFAR